MQARASTSLVLLALAALLAATAARAAGEQRVAGLPAGRVAGIGVPALQTLRQAVVRLEVDVDAFSLAPALNLELKARGPRSQYERELARRLRRGSAGTGFFVNASGDLVTNAHVVLSGVRYPTLPFSRSEWESLARLVSTVCEVWVTVGEGDRARTYSAAPVAIAEDLDLAVVRVALPPGERPTFSYLTIGSSDGLGVGQSVTALGFPENEFQASAGELRSLIYGTHVHDEMRLVRGSSPGAADSPVTVSGTSPGPLVRFQHSAETGHGSSGGPLLDSKNRVIGITYSSLTDRNRPQASSEFNLAIAANVLRRFLREHAIPFTEAAR